jgi:hypothetical protein
MPDAGRAGKAAAKDRPGQGARKADKRAARQRSALEAELAKADKLIAKRTAQLQAANAERAKVATRLSAAGAPAPAKAAVKPTAKPAAKAATAKPAAKAAPTKAAPAKAAPAKAAPAKAAPAKAKAAASTSGPMAYCLRDKTRVAMVGAKAVVLAGGRKGVAGTCPKCGAKLVRLGAL